MAQSAPNRGQFERAIQNRLFKVNRRYREQIRESLGNPPNYANVPSDLWDRLKAEVERELAIVLVLLWRDQLYQNTSGMPQQGVQYGEQWAQQRAAKTAARYVANLQRQLLAKAARWRADGGAALTGAEMDAALRGLLGPYRSRTIAATETTKGLTLVYWWLATQYPKLDKQATTGEANELVWLLGPCQHCSFCPLMHNQPSRVWRLYSDGPPAHPNCCCSLQIVPAGTKFNPPPPDAAVRAALRKSGVSRPSGDMWL